MEFYNIKGSLAADAYLIQFDGGAVPNPGTCGSGAVLFNSVGKCIWEVGEYCSYGTNNTAEYRGLELGLQMALDKGVRSLKIEGDSNLVIQQIAGKWKVRNDTLKVIYGRVMELIKKFDAVACRHVYREYNTRADSITNELQETKVSFSRAVTQ